ncbi:hypothetical protein KL86DYS1_11207 [uncultured Dysgonomonas sp.]|uniref:Uncharacterized protein n=1 Tax=uncultured Dysgonomonas sp. TaxID=206096 RepID=A0A212J5L0_9BACT|nr:hypothetical protein KL86DYS1_11207 [uncultured Dysgonomonas sp.]
MINKKEYEIVYLRIMLSLSVKDKDYIKEKRFLFPKTAFLYIK